MTCPPVHRPRRAYSPSPAQTAGRADRRRRAALSQRLRDHTRRRADRRRVGRQPADRVPHRGRGLAVGSAYVRRTRRARARRHLPRRRGAADRRPVPRRRACGSPTAGRCWREATTGQGAFACELGGDDGGIRCSCARTTRRPRRRRYRNRSGEWLVDARRGARADEYRACRPGARAEADDDEQPHPVAGGDPRYLGLSEPSPRGAPRRDLRTAASPGRSTADRWWTVVGRCVRRCERQRPHHRARTGRALRRRR